MKSYGTYATKSEKVFYGNFYLTYLFIIYIVF
jgi:hypothetical protein